MLWLQVEIKNPVYFLAARTELQIWTVVLLGKPAPGFTPTLSLIPLFSTCSSILISQIALYLLLGWAAIVDLGLLTRFAFSTPLTHHKRFAQDSSSRSAADRLQRASHPT